LDGGTVTEVYRRPVKKGRRPGGGGYWTAETSAFATSGDIDAAMPQPRDGGDFLH
jgi:hypothetical protein